MASPTHGRALVGVSVVVEYTHRDQYGEPAAAATTPTVAVSRLSDAATVTAGAVVDAGSGLYQATIAAADNDQLDVLLVDWTADGYTHRRTVDIVGGYMFSLADFDAVHSIAALTAARKRAVRTIVETEAEIICRRSWVPRFRQQKLVGHYTHELLLDEPDIRSLRTASWTSGSNVSNTFTAAQIAAVSVHPGGRLHRHGVVWPAAEITVGVEVGPDLTPPDVVEAAQRRMEYWASQPMSAIPNRAVSFDVTDGGTYRLAGGTPKRTGDPDVDAVYLRHRIDNLLLAAP